MRALLVGLALLAGCASQQQMRWYKTGSTQQSFNVDAGGCDAQAFSIAGVSALQAAIVYNQCMYGRGWEQVPAKD